MQEVVPEVEGGLQGKPPAEESEQPLDQEHLGLYTHLLEFVGGAGEVVLQQDLKAATHLGHDLVLESHQLAEEGVAQHQVAEEGEGSHLAHHWNKYHSGVGHSLHITHVRPEQLQQLQQLRHLLYPACTLLVGSLSVEGPLDVLLNLRAYLLLNPTLLPPLEQLQVERFSDS